jgi:hypothetical protein
MTTATPSVSPARLPLRGRDLLFLFCGVVLFLGVFHGAAPRVRFQYDEADYMVAARMGLRENYLETSSLSFPAYLKAGWQALSQRVERTDLSEYIRQRGDVSFYRHYHGPLYFYWLALVSRLASGEPQVRAAGLAFHLLAFVIVFAGVLWLLGPEGRPAAWIASSAYLLSVTNIRASLGVSTHQMYACLALLTLFLIARFLTTARTGLLLGAVVCATVALCTLEYGVLLFVVLAVSAGLRWRHLLARNPELRSGRVVGGGLGLFLGTVALLWPAGLFKLSMLKGYMVIPYLALMRKESFGKAGFADVWSARLTGSPVEYALLFACLGAGVFALTRFRSRPELAPFVLYACLILLITLKSDVDRYMSSAPPALYIVGGVLLAEQWPRRRWGRRGTAAAALLCFVLLLASSSIAVPASAPALAGADDTVGFVSGQRDRLRSVLVPAPCVPTMHYYLPELTVRSYVPDRGREHILRRLDVAPVDALFVYSPAEERLQAELAQRFRAETRMGPRDPDPACGPFVVYYLNPLPG